MILHVHIPRKAALNARKSRYGDLTVEVTDEWLEQLGEAELQALEYFGTEKIPIGRGSAYGHVRHYHEGTIDLAEPTPEAVAAWLTATVEAAAAYRAEKNREVEEREQELLEQWEERASEMLDGGIEGVIRSCYAESYNLANWPTVYQLAEEKARQTYPTLAAELDALFAAADVRAQERMAEKKAEVEAGKQRKAEEKARHDRERLDWIATCGSKHLQELVEHNFPFAKTYRTERREAELGSDWVDYADICGETKTIRDPSPEALKAWKEMQKLCALRRDTAQMNGQPAPAFDAKDIKLEWLGDGQHGRSDEPDDDDYSCPLCGDRIEQRPVLTIEYMGDTFVHEIE